jgi:hypothetical protein
MTADFLSLAGGNESPFLLSLCVDDDNLYYDVFLDCMPSGHAACVASKESIIACGDEIYRLMVTLSQDWPGARAHAFLDALFHLSDRHRTV